MEHATKTCLIYLLLEFQPISHFYANILIEEKGFEKETVQRSVIPYYFYSAIAALVVCMLLVAALGYSVALAIGIGFQMLMFFLLHIVRPTNLRCAQAIYCLGCFFNLMKIAMRVMLVDPKSPVIEQLARLKLLRYLVYTFSAWLGQGLYNITGHYRINYYISVLSCLAALLLALSDAGSTALRIRSVGELRAGLAWAQLASVFDEFAKNFTGLFCGISASIVMIYLAIFSSSFFHVDPQAASTEWDRLLYVLLDVPVNALALLIVKAFTFFSPRFAPSKSEHRTRVKSGYIDGLVKILSSLLGVFFIRSIKKLLGAYFLLTLHSIFLALFVAIVFAPNVSLRRIAYLVAFPIIVSLEIAGKSHIYKTAQPSAISFASIFIENLIHTLIHATSSYRKRSTACSSALYLAITMFAELNLLSQLPAAIGK
ncbi:hypothetical protein PAPHI01_0469 [Pancytospora philotis]|nr:hypothetical protein PAPHI01_0469 [Pancytospora philotis]